MSHNNHTSDHTIRELTKDGVTPKVLEQMAEGWEDPFPPPEVEKVQIHNPDYYLDRPWKTFFVVRDDLPQMGSKGRFGSLLVQRIKDDTIVYVAPRVGWAAISLAKLCHMYGKRLILFAPACRVPSSHQRVAMELGADMRFYRVAAMPNLQREAEEFAKKHGYFYAPLGLRHPLVTAAIVATVKKIMAKRRVPLTVKEHRQMWCAMSTGVLSRGLQLALPNWEHHGVCVARNIQPGERGHAILHSHPFPFLQDERPELRPPFPSAANYDAKVWRFMTSPVPGEGAKDGAWFWNVAGESEPQHPLPRNWSKSDKPYGDRSAFRRK